MVLPFLVYTSHRIVVTRYAVAIAGEGLRVGDHSNIGA
jgi:hypothetical protein